MEKRIGILDAIEKRKAELRELARKNAGESKRIEFDKRYRETDAVSEFKGWLSNECHFDTSNLDVSASEQRDGLYYISVYLSGGIVVLLASFSLQDKKPITIRTPDIWRASHSGVGYEFSHFIDAACYAITGQVIYS